MAFTRLPRYLANTAPMTEGRIEFEEQVDLHPRDTVVFSNGSVAMVNSVEYIEDGGTIVVLGADPACAPPVRAHAQDPEAEPNDFGLIKDEMTLTEGDIGTLQL